VTDALLDWVPSLPAGWKVKPFFAVLSERDQPNHDLSVERVLSLSYGKIIDRETESNTGLLPASFDGYNIVEPGDIVMRLTDMQNDQRSLRTGQVEERGIITSAYVTVTPGQDLYPRFAHYLLHGYDLAKIYYRMGGGLRQSMKFSDLRRLPLIVPPRTQQERIANFLDKKTARIDALIAEKERLASLLEEHRKSLISHAVAMGLRRDVEVRPSGLEWPECIPVHWQVKRMKHLGAAIIGLTYSPENVVDEGSGLLVLRASNVQAGKLAFDDNVYVDAEVPSELITRAGDILICSRSGSRNLIGKSAVIDLASEGHTFGAFMMVFRGANNDFLKWVLASHLFEQHSASFLTSTINQLTVATLGSLKVPLPPAGEREAISEYLGEQTGRLDALHSHVLDHVERLQEYRSSLISAAVTGQINLDTFKVAA